MASFFAELKRRKLLKVGAICTIAAVLLPACDITDLVDKSIAGDYLDEVTITQLQEKMQAGDITARQLVDYYLDRIEVIDPDLNAVLEINPDAYQMADSLDRERRAGNIRSPLHGIPVLIKDNIETADSMKTTAGSLALLDAPPPVEDAFVVQQLRDAGAIILGKTNLTEWANFKSSFSSSGWSGRGGQTRNPYILDRSPCGSSSGSGAAVAANLTVVAVGTETDGSIICPSSINGVVGIKPTLGLVSRSGIIPIAHSQDTAGPMARTVTDAVLLLNAMIGKDDRDPASNRVVYIREIDYTRYLQVDGLNGKRIGVVRQLFNSSPAMHALMDEQMSVLNEAGATLVDVAFDSLQEIGRLEMEVLLYEFKSDINRYLQAREGSVRSLSDLIQFNIENAEQELGYFDQEIFLQSQKKGNLDEEAYITALQTIKRLSQQDGIDALVAEHRLDAFVAPARDIAWMIDLIRGDISQSLPSARMAAVSGYPSITVPAGFIKGLPVGILFFGPAFSEPDLIAIAYDYEQRHQARQPPEFLDTYQ